MGAYVADTGRALFSGPAVLGSVAPERAHPITFFFSAELSHNFKVSVCRRSTPKSGQNRTELLCAGLWASCRVFWAWCGFDSGPNPGSKSEISGRILKVFGALLAQPIFRGTAAPQTPRFIPEVLPPRVPLLSLGDCLDWVT